MASIVRSLLLLLVLVHAAFAALPETKPSYPSVPNPPATTDMPGDQPTSSNHQKRLNSMARKLMMNCINKGFQVPTGIQDILQKLAGMEKTDTDKPKPLLDFLDTLQSLPTEAADTNRDPQGTVPGLPLGPEYLNRELWNSSNPQAMLKLMRLKTSLKAHACFMRGFLAPLSLDSLMAGTDMNSEDHDNLLWAAQPLLKNMPPSDLALPQNITRPNMERMMRMLKEGFASLSEMQRTQIKKWVRQHVSQNNFNCTLKPRTKPDKARPAAAGDGAVTRCPRKLKWLAMKEMMMMGPFLSRLRPTELDAASDDQLCEFFRSENFSSSFQGVAGMSPALARRFLDRIKKCTNGQEMLSQQLERFGMLACYYKDDPPVNMTLKSRLLAQLNECDNFGAKKLKKLLVKKLMASGQLPSLPDLLFILGSGMSKLSAQQLSSYTAEELKMTLKGVGRKVKMRLGLARKLVKSLLKKGENVSAEDLVSVGGAVKGVPLRILRKMNAKEMLGNGSLEDVTQMMTKGQKEALMEGLRKNVQASELIMKLPALLRSTLSLNDLKRANLTSLDQVEGKQWTRAQAIFLLKKLMKKNIKPKVIRRLQQAILGMTCRMMERVAEKDSLEMVDALTETPQLLSKDQVTCAARKLFAAYESERRRYFLNVTDQELEVIPTQMLIHLAARKIRSLPDSVCATFLTKMSSANLSSLAPGSLSRPALTNRSLLCLANGRSMAEVSSEEILDLGQLVCELSPAHLRLFSQEALNSSLQAMAACPHIPRRHHMALLRLLKQTYGNVSDWSQETMESFGPLLLLDESEIKNLSSSVFKPWQEAVLSDLKDSRMNDISSDLSAGLKALRRLLFSIKTRPGGARRRRGADVATVAEPTVQLIEELAEDNNLWTPQQLQGMSTETFMATTETLRSITDYSSDQLVVLKGKAVEAFGPVGSLNESVLIQLGCVSQGFSGAELEDLPLALETLEELSDCRWLQAQRVAIWKGFSTRSNLKADTLGAADIVTLNQFICGLSPEDIGKIQPAAFRDSVSSVGDMQCPLSVIREFKKLAVTLLGEPRDWTEAEVSTVGNIVVGLNADEMRSLEAPVFAYLSKDSIHRIPVEVFSALTLTQLRSLGAENLLMVTPAQREALTTEQRAALDETLTDSRAEGLAPQPHTADPPQSGAPSMTIEGIAAFMKPFLFLFLGLLLL
ncbi:otoancorin isoform X2 [Gadus macrocephalus]|nr:otoancorin isoform X2 [Gadus macrocephalus]XP_059909739.1 otoancorin isoform X2 [Gadus macrocephalus]